MERKEEEKVAIVGNDNAMSPEVKEQLQDAIKKEFAIVEDPNEEVLPKDQTKTINQIRSMEKSRGPFKIGDRINIGNFAFDIKKVTKKELVLRFRSGRQPYVKDKK